MFSLGPQKVEVDGELLPVASLTRRGAAIAVDLCLAVGAAAVAFYLISRFAPLDTPAAKGPIAVVMILLIAYLAIARNKLGSPGRTIYGLRLARLPGPVPGLFGRQVTVHARPEPGDDGARTAKACLVAALCTVLAGLSLTAALQTTTVFRTVQDYVAAGAQSRWPGGRLAAPELSAIPRALLVSHQRAYVQIGARWDTQASVLEFFMVRDGESWRITHVRESDGSMLGNYSLGIAEGELPPPPS